ncbi:hypothetical protein VL10_ORF192 [Staphylococcus phage vB_SauM_VL10]|nr:hypothetical protein VL10_ORF192 [Staphylococcus phage vB_SauM_VL10]
MKKILSLTIIVFIVLSIVVVKNQEVHNNQEQETQVETIKQEEPKNNDVDDHTDYVPENNGEHKDVSEERKRLWGTEYQEGETHNPNARVYNQDTGEQVQ